MVKVEVSGNGSNSHSLVISSMPETSFEVPEKSYDSMIFAFSPMDFLNDPIRNRENTKKIVRYESLYLP